MQAQFGVFASLYLYTDILCIHSIYTDTSLSLCDTYIYARTDLYTHTDTHFIGSTLWTGVSEWVKSLSCVWLFATLWNVAYQASLSIGFSRQESWSGLPCPYPEDLPDPGIEPVSPALEADALTSEPPGKILWIGVGVK